MKREEAIKMIADHFIGNCVTVQSDKDINVPSKWIPVTERLPEDGDGTVLILMPNKFPHNQKEPYPKAKHDCRVRIGKYSVYSMRWYIGDMCCAGGDDPIAWMPLPEPPKEG